MSENPAMPWREQGDAQRELAAISEGFCPDCSGALVPLAPDVSVGQCRSCACWWSVWQQDDGGADYSWRADRPGGLTLEQHYYVPGQAAS